MAADDDRLDHLAGSISDGRDVDWSGEEASADVPGQEESVRAMRDVAKIAAFHRAIQRSPTGAAGPATPFREQAEPRRWGNLTLLELVGAGATGEVWRCWDPALQREVALKFLQPKVADGEGPVRAALLEEARALARVHHPGVVAVYGIAEHDGRAGMWMEFLRGRTLADEIDRRGALPLRDVVTIGLSLCAALEAIDLAGIVHRDLKPANVMLEPDGRVVLTDFGLGWRRALGDADSPRGLGTPVFMSPTLLAGGAATSQSDAYALGVTLRWALAGRAPFTARTLEELRAEAARGPAVPLRSERPDAPLDLIAAIERAMDPAPGSRRATPTEVSEHLERARRALDRTAARAPVSRLLAIAAVLAASIAAAIWLVPRLRTTSAPGTPVTKITSSSYAVDATLVARNGGAYRRLGPGDRVAPGDRLSLEFRATRPVWVYVLNEDERGQSYLLFPQPLFDRSNPIPSDSTAVLPGTIGGRENGWVVTSRGGKEHFLVVASQSPVREIEDELSRLPAARPGRPVQYAAIPDAAVEQLRGVGGVAPLPAAAPASRGNATFDRFQELAGRETVTQKVWARTITLDNPLH